MSIRAYARYFSIRNIKELLAKYEKYWSPGALLLGFIVDSITLTRADNRLDNLILLSYLMLTSACIIVLYRSEARPFGNIRVQKLVLLLPLVLQFAFGGLFSGFVVLYSRSASFAASWPFIIALAILLIGNEYFRGHYRRLTFQISVFFIGIFSYLIFAVPILLKSIGPVTFVLSGITSLLVIALVIYILKIISPVNLLAYKRVIFSSVLTIFAAFNILYFFNFIPPIPLSLKQAVVAHDVSRDGANNFLVTFEPPKWYQFFKDYNPTFHQFGNEPVFAYSSVYAPIDLKTTIVHEWSHFDEASGKWLVSSRLQFNISGGRQDGFRGFSIKSNTQPGKWRVAVKTQNGQVLGRTTFNIENSPARPEVITEIK